jgi:hypothetical protein
MRRGRRRLFPARIVLEEDLDRLKQRLTGSNLFVSAPLPGKHVGFTNQNRRAQPGRGVGLGKTT